MNDDDWRSRIVCDPETRGGEPCVRGTRVPVSAVVSGLADLSFDDLLKEYPRLTRADVTACLFYAAEASHNSLVA